jgi:hypothetical protein
MFTREIIANELPDIYKGGHEAVELLLPVRGSKGTMPPTIVTSRPSLASRVFYTSPIPPAPIDARIS